MGRYRKEFKEDAVNLVLSGGYKAAEAARKLGIPHTTLENWLKNKGWNGARAAPLSEDPKTLQLQNRDLQAQVKQLQMDLEILKKAMAFFAKLNR